MLILLFVVVPTLIVAGYAVVQSLRNRQPTSIESGVDAFRREMDALSPHAAPVQRRPGERLVEEDATHEGARGSRPDGAGPPRRGPSGPPRGDGGSSGGRA